MQIDVPESKLIEALLLSREWRDGPDGIEITLFGVSPTEGPIRATFRGQEAVFFVPRWVPTERGRRESKPLRTREGHEVDAIYFRSQRALKEERERLRQRLEITLESDVKPTDRFLMERFITGGFALRGRAERQGGVLHFTGPHLRAADVRPRLRLLSLDIETDGFDGPVLSIALAGEGFERVFLHGEGRDSDALAFFPDEASLLRATFEAICGFDPDVLAGWNVVEFDLRALAARCAALALPFAIGRAGERARVLEGSKATQPSIARVPGRVVLDGIATLRSATYAFERFSLDHVAKALLGRGKAMPEGKDPLEEIRRMHADDPRALAAYNLEDARLVLEIFEATDLLGFAVERAYLTGLPLDRQGGSVAAFDHLYLPRLHRRGFVAPDVGLALSGASSPGGHVLDSVPGLYRNVLSFDFRSLYPSIIRTFCIDPLGLFLPDDDRLPGFDGASFAREGAILPEIVAHLAEARAKAHEAGDDALQRAIKILMNSFYGVLGTEGCRFFDPRLVSSITLRGHEIIERARDHFLERGLSVIYGDTDSLFVCLPETLEPEACVAEGERLAREVSAALAGWLRKGPRAESFLELRLDAHYLRFLMPTTRGTTRGSKKRYAGLVQGPSAAPRLVVRGLEAVRSDWTPLARETQRELLRRVFMDEPFDAWLRQVRAELEAGRLDDRLVYRRRLRRRPDDYEGAPPHIRAARRLEPDAARREIEYVITTRGPEPLHHVGGPIDYAHYVDRQLAPAVDVVLTLLGQSFEGIAGRQLRLF